MTIESNTMTNLQTIRILAKGGVISPGDLHKLCQVARENTCETLGLGCRQELFLQIPVTRVQEAIEGLVNTALPFDTVLGRKANIVTSYGAMGIHPATPWLLADTYLDILEQFDYQPRLKINLTDPQQPLIPRFSGELNFIASAYPTFWHLHMQLPAFGSIGRLWPVLVSSEEIARLCYTIEQVYFAEELTDLSSLIQRVAGQLPDLTARATTQTFSVPMLPFPAYEGFHDSGNGCWLGIFRRDYSYPLAFVEELCELALRCKIGKICLTPWKTPLIKDIRPEHRPHWEKLLGIHHISIHHAATELNWQLPDLDAEALSLKKHLVRHLEESECNTSGLSFAIGSLPMPIATSVVIEPEPGNAGTFAIRHTADFTRSNARWRLFAKQVPANTLAGKLRELCVYYHTSAELGQAEPQPILQDPKPAHAEHPLFQCSHCLTVYDPQLGDPGAGVPTGISFEHLPDDYMCSLCEGHKNDFVLATA